MPQHMLVCRQPWSARAAKRQNRKKTKQAARASWYLSTMYASARSSGSTRPSSSGMSTWSKARVTSTETAERFEGEDRCTAERQLRAVACPRGQRRRSRPPTLRNGWGEKKRIAEIYCGMVACPRDQRRGPRPQKLRRNRGDPAGHEEPRAAAVEGFGVVETQKRNHRSSLQAPQRKSSREPRPCAPM